MRNKRKKLYILPALLAGGLCVFGLYTGLMIPQAAEAGTTTPAATSPTSSTVTTTASVAPATTQATACNYQQDLSGSISGSTGTVTNNSKSCSYDVGIASYKKFDEILENQELYSSATAHIGPNKTIQLSVGLPDCKAQVDLFYGLVITSFNGDRYGSRLLSSVHLGSSYCQKPGSPGTPTTSPTSGSNTPTTSPTSGSGTPTTSPTSGSGTPTTSPASGSNTPPASTTPAGPGTGNLPSVTWTVTCDTIQITQPDAPGNLNTSNTVAVTVSGGGTVQVVAVPFARYEGSNAIWSGPVTGLGSGSYTFSSPVIENSLTQPMNCVAAPAPSASPTAPGSPGTTSPANPGTTAPSSPVATSPAGTGTTAPASPVATSPAGSGTTAPASPGATAPAGNTLGNGATGTTPATAVAGTGQSPAPSTTVANQPSNSGGANGTGSGSGSDNSAVAGSAGGNGSDNSAVAGSESGNQAGTAGNANEAVLGASQGPNGAPSTGFGFSGTGPTGPQPALLAILSLILLSASGLTLFLARRKKL